MKPLFELRYAISKKLVCCVSTFAAVKSRLERCEPDAVYTVTGMLFGDGKFTGTPARLRFLLDLVYRFRVNAGKVVFEPRGETVIVRFPGQEEELLDVLVLLARIYEELLGWEIVRLTPALLEIKKKPTRP